MVTKKAEIQKLINQEHGINFHKNINLSGYIIYRQESFIAFRFVEVNKKMIAVIDYIYITNKNDLIKLLSFCVNFWSGYVVKFIYYKEHRRSANYVQKYFKSLGFEILSQLKENAWKRPWTSTNGFDENEIVEAWL